MPETSSRPSPLNNDTEKPLSSQPEVQGEGQSYRVLARKYRPLQFEDLIGQEAMVRTLSNAFDSGRIPQAWMLTGVRGVGKTTTARILARGLNYQKQDGTGKPTIHMPTLGIHCQSIMESRHIDVMEMDAASHTGIDDVRQITDNVRYTPVSARYKVYIIDEVHMLSDKAFNAFLKTLEEPPSHAKFIFATTEIRKVPITILSRCQRFDLRRVDGEKITNHLIRICTAEQVQADQEALSAIARASEGSVRDSLSLLDQAIAHGAGQVTAQTVQEMLGLADRSQIVSLFESLMKGNMQECLSIFRCQYNSGAEPFMILSDLAAFAHLVTRFKLVPETAKDPIITEIERIKGLEFSESLSVRILSRAWQILLKGIHEVQTSNRPVIAAEMVLVRIAYASDLPTPDEAVRLIKGQKISTPSGGDASPSPITGSNISNPSAQTNIKSHSAPVISLSGATALAPTQAIQPILKPTIKLKQFQDIIALAEKNKEIILKTALERDVRLISFEEGKIEFSLADGASKTLANDLSKTLFDWTGIRWGIVISSGATTSTLREEKENVKNELRTSLEKHPLVLSVMNNFPGAQIIDIHQKPQETTGKGAENLFEDSSENDFTISPEDLF